MHSAEEGNTDGAEDECCHGDAAEDSDNGNPFTGLFIASSVCVFITAVISSCNSRFGHGLYTRSYGTVTFFFQPDNGSLLLMITDSHDTSNRPAA